MKKRNLRILIVMVVCALLQGVFPLTAAAATETTNLFTLEETRNMGISVKYETEPPAVEFIAPDGTVYGEQAIAEGKMTKTDSGTALFFRILNAQPGTWQIQYDKKSNANIEVGYAPHAAALAIEQFSFSEAADGVLDVQFLVTHSAQLWYDYSLYAVIVENGAVTGQKMLKQGYADANQLQQINVYLNGLSTHSGYRLMLEVNAQENGTPVFNSAVSDAGFDYVDPNAQDAPEGFYVEIETIAGALLIDWKNTAAAYRETLVAVYINEAAEPSYYNSFEDSVTSTEIVLDLATTTKVRVDVSYKDYRGRASQIASRTVDMALASAVTLEGQDISAAAQAEVVYQLEGLPGGPFPAVLTVNDVAQELSLQGNDSFSVKLDAFQNAVDLLWYYEEHTAFRLKKEIYSDRLAPSLYIPDVTGKVLTNQPDYILTGHVDPGCTVTVNGKEVAVDNSGVFTTKLPLVAGENSFTVVAVGPTGNRTQQEVVVEWVVPVIVEGSGRFAVLLNYIPLAVSVLLSVTLSLFLIFSGKKFRTVQDEKGTGKAILAVGVGCSVLLIVLAALVTAVFAGLWLYLGLKTNSVEFYNAVVSSGVNQAYGLLKTRDAFMWGTIISAGCVVVCIGLCILLKKLAKKPPKAQTETWDNIPEEE